MLQLPRILTSTHVGAVRMWKSTLSSTLLSSQCMFQYMLQYTHGAEHVENAWNRTHVGAKHLQYILQYAPRSSTCVGAGEKVPKLVFKHTSVCPISSWPLTCTGKPALNSQSKSLQLCLAAVSPSISPTALLGLDTKKNISLCRQELCLTCKAN
eukprot:1156789-Pelagomonas_calceolata.AAC.1